MTQSSQKMTPSEAATLLSPNISIFTEKSNHHIIFFSGAFETKARVPPPFSERPDGLESQSATCVRDANIFATTGNNSV